ncbi:DUF192 domain-containing protein (plasmid) [Haloplanus rubicundus]|uniref:DUF192 domain-containing protein n=1 Tax=Haloplanus rubicundus TaxID=1547898 RepID=A0A345E805_9EURY|nr:DUF192 domain-containing protein [Haloplanus rubicundus]AXG08327.1 DUF192 domain-containing protein [Haloplanus rubicundus]
MDNSIHAVPTVDSLDCKKTSGTPIPIFERRATVVAALVIGATVFAVAGAVFLMGVGASSTELESSVIDDKPPTHRVFFENQRGQILWVYDVWVADTDSERYQGLSGTGTLPADTGLLFVYDQEAADRAIVMREMHYPIDVVFIDGSGTVTAVHSPVPEPSVPDDELTHYSGRARWILEIPHGTAERHAIVPRTSIQITGSTHAFDPQSASHQEGNSR